MSRSIFAMASLAAICCLLFSAAPHATAGTDIIYDGGDHDWNDDPLINGEPGRWNGGQAAFDVFGREDGWQFGSGEIGSDVFILSGNVSYDTNFFRDFRFISGAPENGGTLTIGDGPGSPASLSMDISFDLGADQDGFWSQFNADTLNLNNGTFRRTHTETSDGTPSSGGLMQFGGIRGYPNADIKVNMTNGGRIENDGQMTFGWYLQGDDAVGRKITFTINDGHIDLTGSTKWDHLGGAAGGAGNADLSIHYGWDSVADAPAGEEYAINFTGPGSITVDEGGILVVRQTAFTDQPDPGAFDISTITTPRTYEYLWDEGILQANGLSGPDGANFSDFFMTENNLGEADYKLISLVVEPPLGDYTENGYVGGDDLVKWQQDLGMTADPAGSGADGDASGTVDAGDLPVWGENLGVGVPEQPQVGAVPEPTSLVLVGICLLAGCSRRGR